MIALRFIGSTYLMIASMAFLLLPSCPCEIMALFGGELHEHVEPPEGTSFENLRVEPFYGHCLCDEEVPKFAEAFEDSSERETEHLEAGDVFFDVYRFAAIPSRIRPTHPPPENSMVAVQLRLRTGVYLI